MLRPTLLAACLLAALQITNVAGITGYVEKTEKLTVAPGGETVKTTVVTVKKGQTEYHFNKTNLPECKNGNLGHGSSLSLSVVDRDFDDILIAEDKQSALVRRKNAIEDAEVNVEVMRLKPTE